MKQLNKEVFEYYLYNEINRDDLLLILRYQTVIDLFDFLNDKKEEFTDSRFIDLYKSDVNFIRHMVLHTIELHRQNKI